MTHIEVFDPPMCCSSGVCGPSVDPLLAAFAADVEWLTAQGVTIARHNLSQNPQPFVSNTRVRMRPHSQRPSERAASCTRSGFGTCG